MTGLLIAYVLAFVLLIICNREGRLKPYRILAKGINSLLFIGVATYGMLQSGDSALYYAMLPGLVMCLIGDVLLAVPKQRYFLQGLVAFLIAHILLTRAFCSIQPFAVRDFILPLLMVGVTWALCQLPGIDVHNMRTYIVIYAFFVTLGLSKSIGIVSAELTARNLMLAIGYLLFWISDVILFFICFYKKSYKYAGFLNLLTYYGGMLMIAYSICMN